MLPTLEALRKLISAVVTSMIANAKANPSLNTPSSRVSMEIQPMVVDQDDKAVAVKVLQAITGAISAYYTVNVRSKRQSQDVSAYNEVSGVSLTHSTEMIKMHNRTIATVRTSW